MLRQVFFWLAITWTGIILFLCLVKSSDLPQVNMQNLDKVVHAFFHFVFTTLWYLVFKKRMNSSTITKPLVVSFMFSVFFGILVEILQWLCTTTRTADVFDVLANVTGATLAVIGIILLDKYSQRTT